MVEGRCSKRFPKLFTNETTSVDSGQDTSLPEGAEFTNYKRRSPENGGRTFRREHDDEVIDNSWVVSYNPALSLRYNAHINVEVCNHARAVKYLFKYFMKGQPRIQVSISEPDGGQNDREVESRNEIDDFIDALYISPNEACWRLLSFWMFYFSHTVIRLPLHLEGQQTVVHDGTSDGATAAMERNARSMLTAYFEQVCDTNVFCLKALLLIVFVLHQVERETQANVRGDPPHAWELAYVNFPKYYTWQARDRVWKRRTRSGATVIPRIRFVQPSAGEVFHLRALLLHVRGATSFASLRTVNGVEHNTFRAACEELGLLEHDAELIGAMRDCSHVMSADAVRRLFVCIIMNFTVSDPHGLFEDFEDSMSEDYAYRRSIAACLGVPRVENADGCRARIEVRRLLSEESNDNINALDIIPIRDGEESLEPEPDSNVVDHGDITADEAVDTVNQFLQRANEGQLRTFHIVLAALRSTDTDSRGKTFFLHASAGTGKTFVAKALIAAERCCGRSSDVVASSGFAAELLPGGVTAHSRFGIPVPTIATSTSTIRLESERAQLMKMRRLVVWDEVVMASSLWIDVVDRFLRDLMDVDAPFGGKIVVLMGDSRQILPVVPHGSPADVLRQSLTHSKSWEHTQMLELTENMRVATRAAGDDQERVRRWNEFLQRVGDGNATAPPIRESMQRPWIAIPDEIMCNGSALDLAEKVFGGLDSQRLVDTEFITNRAILCPTLKSCAAVNDLILDRLAGDDWHFVSADRVLADDDGASAIPTESLNRTNRSGMPLHDLRLRPGCVVMLLRKLDASIGLTNGSRLQVISATLRLVSCRILGGRHHGKQVGIPRIRNQVFEGGTGGLAFERRQFPLAVAYAMSINKGQGQTLQTVGVNLETPCFSHGQLFVALSRSGDPGSVFVRVVDQPGVQGRIVPGSPSVVVTPNIVWRNIFEMVASRPHATMSHQESLEQLRSGSLLQELTAGAEEQTSRDVHREEQCASTAHEEERRREGEAHTTGSTGDEHSLRYRGNEESRRHDEESRGIVMMRTWRAPAGPDEVTTTTQSWLFVPLIWSILNLATESVAECLARELAGVGRWNTWVAAYLADFEERGISLHSARQLCSSQTGYIQAQDQEFLLCPQSVGGGSEIDTDIWQQICMLAATHTAHQE